VITVLSRSNSPASTWTVGLAEKAWVEMRAKTRS